MIDFSNLEVQGQNQSPVVAQSGEQLISLRHTPSTLNTNDFQINAPYMVHNLPQGGVSEDNLSNNGDTTRRTSPDSSARSFNHDEFEDPKLTRIRDGLQRDIYLLAETKKPRRRKTLPFSDLPDETTYQKVSVTPRGKLLAKRITYGEMKNHLRSKAMERGKSIIFSCDILSNDGRSLDVQKICSIMRYKMLWAQRMRSAVWWLSIAKHCDHFENIALLTMIRNSDNPTIYWTLMGITGLKESLEVLHDLLEKYCKNSEDEYNVLEGLYQLGIQKEASLEEVDDMV